MSSALQTLTSTLAAKLEMGDGADLIETLKQTAFKAKEGQQVSDAQMTALMVIANQYNLNPWTRQIYAYPDKQNGIVPVVGVDGWLGIINSHPQFNGIEFDGDEKQMTCTIYRKDRSHPTKVTEYFDECFRPAYTTREGKEIKGPWQSHPRRMMRHKALIQCARIAFGFGGIFDADEAERIVEATTTIDASTGEVISTTKSAAEKPAKPAYPDDRFEKNKPAWKAEVDSGSKTSAEIVQFISSRATLNHEQIEEIKSWENVSGNVE